MRYLIIERQNAFTYDAEGIVASSTDEAGSRAANLLKREIIAPEPPAPEPESRPRPKAKSRSAKRNEARRPPVAAAPLHC